MQNAVLCRQMLAGSYSIRSVAEVINHTNNLARDVVSVPSRTRCFNSTRWAQHSI